MNKIILRAEPRSLFSWSFEVSDGTGTRTILDQAWVREAGGFQLDGGEYELRREGLLTSTFELSSRGRRLASAEKSSFFRMRFELQYGKDRLMLQPASMISRSFTLEQGERQVGQIVLPHLFRRRIRAELPAQMPKPVCMFTLWLVIIAMRRTNSNSGT